MEVMTVVVIEPTFEQGYIDGLQNLDRTFMNDEELTDEYIDGYEAGQHKRFEAENERQVWVQ